MDKSEKEVLIPTNDFFARYLFANVGSEKILLHFLNALRKDANEVVVKLTSCQFYLPSFAQA